MERAQVWGRPAYQTCEKERASVLAENPFDNQSGQDGEAGAADRDAQPHDQGVGQLSPQSGGERCLPKGGSSHLANALALGTPKASREIPSMGEGTLLSSNRTGRLGFRRQDDIG